MGIEKLLGKTLASINIDREQNEIRFTDTNGVNYRMFHIQDCCEEVTIDDIEGDINDLIGAPITMAEQMCNTEDKMGKADDYVESFTWTFYKLATIKGYVTIKWWGESNGYYSEEVCFVQEN